MREKHLRYLFIWVLWTLVIVSCTLEKRKYFKGYYVGKRHHPQSVKVNSHDEKKSFKSIGQTEIILNNKPFPGEIISFGKPQNHNLNTNHQLISKPKKKFNLNDTCKDELVFKNGERLKVKIVEITPYVVRFYNCTLGSPYVSEIPKNDLSVILPYEGKAEFVDSQNKNNSSNSNKSGGSGTKIHEEVLIGLGLFAILGIVGAIYILIRYKPVRNEMLSNPDKYQGRTLWDVLFYLSIGCVVLVLLYIFIIFALIGL